MIPEFDMQSTLRPQIRQPCDIRHLARESIRGLSRSASVSHCAVGVVAPGEGHGACGVGVGYGTLNYQFLNASKNSVNGEYWLETNTTLNLLSSL